MFLDFLLLHSSPLNWNWHPFLVLVLEGLLGLHRTIQFQLLQNYWSGIDLITVILNGLPWKLTETILSFSRLHPSTAFQTHLLTMMAIPISSKGFLPTIMDIMVIWFKSPIPVHLSSLIPKISMFSFPSLVCPLPIHLDSWTSHSRFLCSITLYGIRLYFHHRLHPQLGIVVALAPFLHSFWSYFSTGLQ